MDAVEDDQFFAEWFKDKETWNAWFAFLKSLFGLPMSGPEAEIFRYCTGRQTLPDKAAKEAWLVVGRRGGKSYVLAVVAVFLACFYNWRPYLSPGERATIVVIATDRRQARVIFRYIEGYLELVPLLKERILRSTTEMFELKGGVVIEVHTASFRAIRGYTIVAALLDEIAFWTSDESVNPDYEIIRSIRPAMATVAEHAILMAASSPYARRGALWENYKRHFAKDDDPILVWKASTDVMHPSLDERIIKEEYDKDPVSAASEYGAEFREDIQNLFRPEVIEDITANGTYELPYLSAYQYVGFVDPSGGSADSYTLAIAHREPDGRAVLDLVREAEPPFSPESVTRNFCQELKKYQISAVKGDRYAGEWPREQFRKEGILYEVCDKAKSEIYLETLPLFNAGQCQLLDNPRMLTQFQSLERKTSRAGRDIIDHPPHGKDDLANAAAGALVYAGAFRAIDLL